MSVYSDRAPTVMRWAVTHINLDGLRVLTLGTEGRWTHATREDAQKQLEAFEPQLRAKVLDERADTLEVREIECWASHLDPCHSVFDEE